MATSASTLIVPVENQVRELDAKLLLSCVAAERGFPVIIGSRAYVHFAAASLPRGIYLAKSMRRLSNSMFRILRMLGHEIIAWEEEALVHPPADTYYSLRLSPITMKSVSHFFVWGQENFELIKQYPQLPENLPIHITGNPRGDILRPEMRAYFSKEVEQLRKTYGDFILINTNFSDVNPFIPSIGLFILTKNGEKTSRRGQGGIGMSEEFVEGLWHHKKAIMESFKQLIPALERAFPNVTIVVRPHPSENQQIYHDIAAQCQRVKVANKGNVIPWLLAAKTMIHNGCTTGLEAYALGAPAISYLNCFNEYYDYDFQGLPTKLSYQSFNFGELEDTLSKILRGELGAPDGEERKKLIDYYLTAQQDRLACERIIDVLEANGYNQSKPPASPTPKYLTGWALSNLKATLTQLYMRRPGPNRLAYHNHRFPDISTSQIEQKIAQFGQLLNRFKTVKVTQHSQYLFKIST
jgi:surface carbohydrate biosynthesis protein